MKVSENKETQSFDSMGRSDNSGSPDAFARLLKRRQEEGQESQARLPEASQENQPVAPEDNANLLPGQPEAEAATDVTGPRSPSSQMDVQKLADEIVQEVHFARGAGGARTVDIQFNAKTLDGLHVHLESSNNVLTVNFSTESSQVVALLNNQASNLHDALESRGYKVNDITVSSQKGPMSARNVRREDTRGGRR